MLRCLFLGERIDTILRPIFENDEAKQIYNEKIERLKTARLVRVWTFLVSKFEFVSDFPWAALPIVLIANRKSLSKGVAD
jgi:hypothetical protein